MRPATDGWWIGRRPAPGTDYGFLLDERTTGAGPALAAGSPTGVHGPSRVYDQHAYEWHDAAGPGATSRAARDLRAAHRHLHPRRHLRRRDRAARPPRRLGVTHVEVLPVNDVQRRLELGLRRRRSGTRCTSRTAARTVSSGSSTPATRAASAVVLDVVYNHLGPSGNYLPRFGPYLKTGRNTWGDLVNFDEPRRSARYVLDNALHVAARLPRRRAAARRRPRPPATTPRPTSSPSWPPRCDALAAELGRPLTLIAESDLNDPMVIRPRTPAAGASTPSGTTTSTTRCTRC